MRAHLRGLAAWSLVVSAVAACSADAGGEQGFSQPAPDVLSDAGSGAGAATDGSSVGLLDRSVDTGAAAGGTDAGRAEPGEHPRRDVGPTPDRGSSDLSTADANPVANMGNPCRGHHDCPGGWCTGDLEAAPGICTIACVEECPGGWFCARAEALEPEVVYLCLPLPAECEDAAPAEEICNAKDDDCDGEVDEGFGVGEPCWEGVEPCKLFALQCSGARETACRPAGVVRSGTLCEPARCEEDAETDAGTCDDEGSCRPGAARTCYPYRCAGAERCATSCVEELECAAGHYCLGGACLPKVELGEPCHDDSACAGGRCVDGVCCAEPCDGTCRSCALDGRLGVCSVLKDAPDPDTCSGERRCDAAGECRLVLGEPCGAGADCASLLCLDGVCCESSCDGLCERCDNPGAEGRCRLLADASPNADPDGECGGACQVCGEEGGEGACVAAEDGSDPEEDCEAEEMSSCGLDGLCGGGACRLWAEGTPCAAPACADGFFTEERFCDGAGSCATKLPSDCPGGFACNATGTGCRGSCATQAHCQDFYRCDTSTRECEPMRCRGSVCESDEQCLPGSDGVARCVDGVCCESACDGACEACDIPGAWGSCVAHLVDTDPEGECAGLCASCDGSRGCAATSAGLDPEQECAAESMRTCGLDGECDGAGGCRLWQEGTVCEPPLCEGNTRYEADVCDGAGACEDGGGEACDGECPPDCYPSCESQPEGVEHGVYAPCDPSHEGASCGLTCSSGYDKTGDALCEEGAWSQPPEPACYRSMIDFGDYLWDPKSNLRWLKVPRRESTEWAECRGYCERYNYPEVGWHMPSIDELRTLIRSCPGSQPSGDCSASVACPRVHSRDCYEHGICKGCGELNGPAPGGCYWDHRMEGPCTLYWSSTSAPDAPGWVWVVDFDYAHIGVASVDPNETPPPWGCRCVR